MRQTPGKKHAGRVCRKQTEDFLGKLNAVEAPQRENAPAVDSADIADTIIRLCTADRIRVFARRK
jgi:hypothetical protein